jgi:beta-mannosidase
MSTGAVPGLLDNWVLASAAPDRIAEPSRLNGMELDWIAAPVPGTVAQALLAAGRWDFEHPRDFDAFDWWYRCRFAPGRIDPGVPARLRFQGLATRAEVWLNGERILNSDNMFQAHVTDVTLLLQETNALVLCFRALTRALAARRPRPRWKTRLVSHQQLRFIRTSLLGRMPGWSPPVAPVGPWRAISLELWRPGTFTDLSIQTRLEGGTGVVEVSAFAPHAAETPVAGTLSVGHVAAELRAEREREGSRLSGLLRIDDPARWWPHTHGAPRLYPASARLVVNGEVTTHDCGGVGFRDVRILREDDGFALQQRARVLPGRVLDRG